MEVLLAKRITSLHHLRFRLSLCLLLLLLVLRSSLLLLIGIIFTPLYWPVALLESLFILSFHSSLWPLFIHLFDLYLLIYSHLGIKSYWLWVRGLVINLGLRFENSTLIVNVQASLRRAFIHVIFYSLLSSLLLGPLRASLLLTLVVSSVFRACLISIWRLVGRFLSNGLEAFVDIGPRVARLFRSV